MSGEKAPYPLRYGLFLGLFYSASAAYQGFIGPFYREARGLNGSRLMWLLAATPAVSMLMQPLWGMAGDRMKTRNTALYIMGTLAIASILMVSAAQGFGLMLMATCLFAATFQSIQPMGDSIILEDLSLRGQPFGPIRLVGSLSFAVANLVFGALFDGRYALVPYATAAFTALMLMFVRVLPKMEGHQRGHKRVPLSVLFQLPYMKPLLMLLTPLMLALGYFYSYFTLYITELPGGSAEVAGFAYFISAVSELPFIFKSDRLFRRFGAGRLMLVSALLLTIRFAILAMARHAYVAVATQLLHSGCFIVITLSASYYINRVVPDELKASGQMLLSMIGFGLARVFGIFCGGLISGITGSLSGGFAFMAVICLVSLALGARYFLRIPPVNGE